MIVASLYKASCAMAEKSEEKGKEKAMEDVKPAAQVKESKNRARNNPRKYYGRPRRDKETQRHDYQDRSPNYDYEWSGEDQSEWVGHDSRDWAGHDPRKWAGHDPRQWAGRPRNRRKEKKPSILTAPAKARNETQSKEDTMTKDSQKPIPIVTNELTTPTQPQTTPTHQELTRRINKVIIVKQGNKKTSRNNRETSKQHKRTGGGEKTVTVSTAQTSELVQQLTAGVYECMVCCDRVRGRDEVWACPKCYNLFHLKCISRWAKSPAAAVNEGTPCIIIHVIYDYSELHVSVSHSVCSFVCVCPEAIKECIYSVQFQLICNSICLSCFYTLLFLYINFC